MINKGMAMKRIRIMGRGRSGVGYKRYTHVTIKVGKVDFDEKIQLTKTDSRKLMWKKRQLYAEKARKKLEESTSNMQFET